MSEYEKFLSSKSWSPPITGIENFGDLSPFLFDFQRDAVTWALKRGRACLFFECGLGKTICQLEWARNVPGDVIIIAPLAVSGQTAEEGKRFGIDCAVSRDGTKKGKITITNYERIHLFDLSSFDGAVVDESSILKSFTGHYRTAIIDGFSETRFKLACTATPAPNDIMELANHVEFMGIMKRPEFLATWFVHDGGDTSSWRLKRHAEDRFYEWMASWSVMMRNPGDLGYRNDGFELPPLKIHEHFVETGISEDGMLFSMPAEGLTAQRKARRTTIQARVDEAARVVSTSNDPWIVWCELNDESAMIASAIPGAVEVKGADKPDDKERALLDFASGKIRVLVTKPKIGGFGMNWQHCHQQVFVGLSNSFEQTYQAIRRSWRFGQTNPVDVHVVITDLESGIAGNVARKESEHEKVISRMVDVMSKATIAELRGTTREGDEYMTRVETGDGWELRLGDAVEESKHIKDESVGVSVFSPPFASLYTYSASDRDMGNCTDYEEFMVHFGFLIDELMRVTMPGRLCCVHCMDLPVSKTREGHIGIRDFPGIIVAAFEKAGWFYHSRVAIWKDPVTAMQRTKALGLLWKQIKKDSTMSRMGLPDYVLAFRKPGDNPEPVSHSSAEFPVDQWQRWASPVWMDINPSDTLQKESARDEKDERHIAPLQLEVTRRCIRLWSNKGDLVLSPFAGIGSEGVVAIQEERRFVGVELKESYFNQARANLATARSQLELFGNVG